MTEQLDAWKGEFGEEFTDRYTFNAEDVDKTYMEMYGKNRTEFNEMFLSEIKKDSKILEIGCNSGNQLLILDKMKFSELYAIEPQDYARNKAKQRLPNCNIIKGDVFDLPFKDGYFDLVFTSVVLIHIAPNDLLNAMKEIYRCSGEYIWGLEYYSHKCEEVCYRGKDNMLWKTDFMQKYLDTFDDLELIKREEISYMDSDKKDVMFLLRKKK